MNEVAPVQLCIPGMSPQAIEKVCELENELKKNPQVDVTTDHVIHAGMYTRTVIVPANGILTGALIKIPTILIVVGDAIAYIGGDTIHLSGYNVVPAAANRKQAIVAITDTILTMMFATTAKTVDEAEKEFTDDYELLLSNHDSQRNRTLITGE